ncbi:hypothetical protein ACQBAU_13980 [Propionibacteriaceae bacterium Y2011]|uniref:hypothetical protein n=1 Tax=Microlunatus sp. Y2014 TaxID=3418488 RepID=UPI003B4C1148
MTITLCDIAVPRPGEPTPLIDECVELTRRAQLAMRGHDDLATPSGPAARRYAEQTDEEKWWVVARVGADLVGHAMVELPRNDNTHLGHLDISVDPTADQTVVRRALWDHVRPRLLDRGRHTASVFTEHRAPAEGDEVAVPGTGSGAIPVDDTCRAMRALGFDFVQIERHSTLVVAEHTDGWADQELAAARHAGDDYEVLHWRGVTPVELRDSMARLRNRMSVDVPIGDMDFQEEEWDAARVERQDTLNVETMAHLLTAAARHRSSGELVAYTVLALPSSPEGAAFQFDTLVHGDHRGHRLGTWVKANNLAAMRSVSPGRERVHTWNADENGPMLAINVALGFRVSDLDGMWQLRFASRPG